MALGHLVAWEWELRRESPFLLLPAKSLCVYSFQASSNQMVAKGIKHAVQQWKETLILFQKTPPLCKNRISSSPLPVPSHLFLFEPFSTQSELLCSLLFYLPTSSSMQGSIMMFHLNIVFKPPKILTLF